MSTEPVSDEYPVEWRPRERRQRDGALETSAAVEAYLASLSAIEFQQLVARCRGRS